MWFTTEDSGQVLDNQASKAASSRKPSWRFLVELISPHCSVVSALCDPMNCSMPGFPVLHYLLEFAQIHVHWDSDAIQPSHLLLPSSLSAFNLSQHLGLFQWLSSLHQVAKVLEFQLQHSPSNEHPGLISFIMFKCDLSLGNKEGSHIEIIKCDTPN